MSDLLEKRNLDKKRKPTFRRQDSNKYSFNSKWRKPRGLHNKRRLNKKGHQKNPSTGYGSPKEVKFLTRDGLNRVLISNMNDIKNINKEKDIVVLSSKLGLKKKLQILEELGKLGLKVENIKDIQKFIEEKKSEFEEKKKKKQKKILKKEKSKKESLKKAKEKEEKKDGDSEDKQKEIKEEVLSAKQEKPKTKEIGVKKDTTQQKAGHLASSVPGTKQ
jgi:large subunit ribosomal protein L32e